MHTLSWGYSTTPVVEYFRKKKNFKDFLSKQIDTRTAKQWDRTTNDSNTSKHNLDLTARDKQNQNTIRQYYCLIECTKNEQTNEAPVN